MALAAILRKSAPSLARLARVNRSNHSAIFITSSHLSSTSFVPIFQFSSAVETKKKPSYDESLMQVIDSEIKCAVEQTDGSNRPEWVPSGFPFKVEDSPGQPTVILIREYQDELVKVEVCMPNLDPGEPPEGDHTDRVNKVGQRSPIIIPLIITVTKNSGRSLEFICSGHPNIYYPQIGYPYKLSIDGLLLRKSETSKDERRYGPDFHDLEDNFRKAFHRYLEIRGIEPETMNWLFQLMLNKDRSEYVLWLKNIKNFFIEA
ncbi:hypothetical protein EZV62_026224 [Acer yangbiense]|uniref:Mitochondrial glycoprotein n=1 Tax=Acer yangbiense TaxID=1000413 RepID=A0A5C7GQY7_9ROSI|nr:hypothetical protein EZV62_026224 [Acer yangbiense]